MDSQTDAQLIQRLNRSDASAFAELYARHADWTFRVARRYCRSDDEAAEVMQEVFMRWLRQFPGFRLQARLTTYLYAATRNLALDRRRKDRRLRFSEIPEVGARDESADDSLTAGDRSDQLRAALSRLPDGFREVLLMRIVDEMSVEDVAVALGVAEGTVKSRLARAVELLKEQLRSPGED